MWSRQRAVVLLVASLVLGAVLPTPRAAGQTAATAAFSYQGELAAGGAPFGGLADFRFRLYNAALDGQQVGSTLTRLNTAVSQGRFEAALDFGVAAFSAGQARWLEVDVRSPAGTGVWVTLTPRQALLASPFAAYALSAPAVTVTAPLALTSAAAGIAVVQGEATNFNSIGVQGRSVRRGVIGVATNTDAAQSINASGVLGQATQGWGVRGESARTGVFGTSSGTEGEGVWGRGGTSGEGVIGEVTGTAGYGVWGTSNGNRSLAVIGEATGTEAVGVFGRATGTNSLAGQFVGSTQTSGTKAFAIDHPLDPANMVLLHYCLESPEPVNMYRGVAVLDGAGRAVVALPAYFEAISRDPTYTLTAVGAAMPSLHVEQEIKGNVFVIAGGAPGAKVSWRVEAARHDAHVRAHGAPAELKKSRPGTYIDPALWGQPAEQAATFKARPAE